MLLVLSENVVESIVDPPKMYKDTNIIGLCQYTLLTSLVAGSKGTQQKSEKMVENSSNVYLVDYMEKMESEGFLKERSVQYRRSNGK